MRSHGTQFVETETLLAALDGNGAEVVERVREMYPAERRLLAHALLVVVDAINDAEWRRR